MADEIIIELWRIKDAIANEYGCDVKKFVAHLRTRKGEAGVQAVDLRSMKRPAEQGGGRGNQEDTPPLMGGV